MDLTERVEHLTLQENANISKNEEKCSPINATNEREALAEVEISLPSPYKNNPVGIPPEKTMKPLLDVGTASALSTAKTTEVPDEVPNVATEGDSNSKRGSESYSSRQLNEVVPDDCSNMDDTVISEYVMDIFSYLKTIEAEFPIREGFLDNNETTPWMRAKLIDWLIGVHMYFDFASESLYLCVAILDGYLQENTNVARGNLQLVGITALLVSSKYEESRIPKLRYFEHICGFTYSKELIKNMENVILNHLDYRLGRALSVQFLRRYNYIAQVRSDHYRLGEFMLELAFLEAKLSHVKPSMQAAVACYLTLEGTCEDDDVSELWTPTLVRYTEYELKDFEAIIWSFCDMLDMSKSSEFQNVITKHAGSSSAKMNMEGELNKPIFKD